MKLEKNLSKPRNRTGLRRALRIALTSVPLLNTPAIAAGEQASSASAIPRVVNMDAPKKKTKAGSNFKNHSVHKPKTPTLDGTKLSDDYSAILEKLRGWHLVAEGPIEVFPGYEEFCRELAIFCDHHANHREGVQYDTAFTPKLFATLASINRQVNKQTKPRTDFEKYGVREKWTMPDGEGDCEDIVLLKMLRLVDAGFAPGSLHILVVYDEVNEGHAVLGVDVFDRGSWHTLILDNKNSDIITLDAMERKYRGTLATFVTRLKDGTHRVNFYNYASRNRR